MVSGTIPAIVGSILSLSLITYGAPHQSHLAVGSTGLTIAQDQGYLDVLGFNAGPVTGTVNQATLDAAANYITQFGPSVKNTLNQKLQTTIQRVGPFSNHETGSGVLAVQDWLHQWNVYSGPLNGRMSTTLTTAVGTFQRDVGIPKTGQLNGPTLAELVHLAAVRTAYRRGWTYHAVSGDSMEALAFAVSIPLSTMEQANPQHGQHLWSGQRVHWRVPKPASPPPSVSRPLSGVPSVTGVLSNIQPVAALVVMNPTSSQVRSLLKAQKGTHDLVDVSVTGQWALTHSALLNALAQAGDEIDVSGYTGQNLNTLPAWGVKQELLWSEKILSSVTGAPPTFVVGPSAPNGTVQGAAAELNLVPMPVNTTLNGQASPQIVERALLAKSQGVVAISPAPGFQWKVLFRDLKQKHFVFLQLGQIWASGNG